MSTYASILTRSPPITILKDTNQGQLNEEIKRVRSGRVLNSNSMASPGGVRTRDLLSTPVFTNQELLSLSDWRFYWDLTRYLWLIRSLAM